MKKTAVILIFSMISFECILANTIEWSTTAVIGDHDSVALANNPGGDGTHPLVQLIYAGADGNVDIANQIGFGVTGDDQVMDYAWIGKGLPPLNNAGMFTTTFDNNTEPNGSLYYIRAWESPSSLAGTGNVPMIDTYYGNSTLFTVMGNGEPPGVDTFKNTTTFDTTIAIPEPAAAALLGIFGSSMLVGRRLFSKKS